MDVSIFRVRVCLLTGCLRLVLNRLVASVEKVILDATKEQEDAGAVEFRMAI